MCLYAVSGTSYGASNGGLGRVPTVAALFVLPLPYVFPAARPLWLRHRYLLLAAQAALTCLPFTWFGADWAPSGWLAGLVLLTVPWPASWFAAAFLAAVEAAIWAGAVGELSNQPNEEIADRLYLSVSTAKTHATRRWPSSAPVTGRNWS
jgi:hypothetical protein